MTTLLELAKKLHNTLALYNGAGYALGWKTEKVDKLLDESKRVIELAEQPAQPQQEPVADEVRCPECGYLTKHTEHIGCLRNQLNAINAFEQRNFAIVNMDKFPQPAQRTWVGLTDEEIDLFINGRGDEDDENYVEPTGDGFGLTDADLVQLVRRSEAKLKAKNSP